MKKRMIVDVQNHFVPASEIEETVKSGIVDLSSQPFAIRWHGVSIPTSEEMVNTEKHISACREAGLTHIMTYETMALTIANEVLGMSTIEVARRQNDVTAQLRDQHSDIVYPLGTVKPHDGKEAAEEARRCIEELGFKGIAIDTSYGTTGREFVHTVETFDFWEYINDNEVPVFLHPSLLCYGYEFMDRYKFEETVGRPAETALSISYMMLSGLFDRFPGLRIILPHMGAALLMCLPRLQFAHRLGYEGLLPYQKAKCSKEPIEYVKANMWADTMGFDPAGIRHALEVFGVDRVMLGTDYSAVPISPREHIDIICNELGLSEEDQDKVLGLNAKDLFDLPDPV